MSARLLNTPALLGALNGSPQYLGSIVTTAATAQNNSTTAVPFTLNGGRSYMVQANGVCYFLAQELAAGATTTANGVQVAANERVIFTTKSTEAFISIIRDSADVTVKVWEVV